MTTSPLALLLCLTGSAAPAFTPDANLERFKVPDVYKWNLAPLFKDDAEFEAGLKKVVALRQGLKAFEHKLADPSKLKECLDRYFEVRLLANKLTLFAHLRLETDQKQTALQAMNDRALDAMNGLVADAGFIRQEVLRLDDKKVKAAYAKVPGLAAYRTYLEDMRRRRAHVLGEEAERTLSRLSDNLWLEIDLNEAPSDLEKAFEAGLGDVPLPKIKDELGKEVQLTLSSYSRYRASPDRRVRRDAVEGLFATLRQYQHLFAATLGGQVRLNVAYARARGYDTALGAYLDKDDVDPRVYTNLIATVRGNLAPLHRYVALRKKLLQVPELHVYDLYTPMVPGSKREIPFEEAQRILPLALAPLGKEYVEVLQKGLDPASGWLDLYPNRDKMSGASSSSVFGVHPFVKMNYLNDFEGLTTLAHELGHALHSHLAMTTQPYVTSSYATFIAEIASTCNEKLLNAYLLSSTTDRQERLALQNRLVESIRTTIYRQALFAEFELAIHTASEQGTPLTAELLGKTYGDLLRAYYGKDLTLGENDEMEWAYIPHLYYKYYVFTYATGLSSGIALAEKIAQGDAAARDAYLGMLKGGDSKPPLELLKGAGVDLARPDAVEAAARLLDATVAQMEK